jgi:hypothetical protein
MLISTDISSTQTAQRLVQIWAQRYKPQASFATQQSIPVETLVYTASPQGRLETVKKLHRNLLKVHCQFAATQTRKLQNYDSPKAVDESKDVIHWAVEIYASLLKFYQQSACASLPETIKPEGTSILDLPWVEWGVADISVLSLLLEPLLLEYQDRHQMAQDWAKVGFLTTHLNFANVAILNHLTVAEQIFLKPYFAFLEEQVAVPWQRVCTAASAHTSLSPEFRLVEQMLSLSDTIAQRVFVALTQRFARMTLRRGKLTHPGVRHSCLRDLNMFQAYFWLCVLKGDLSPVEDELVQLCSMVMPRVGVPWDMIVQWNEQLMTEITNHAEFSQQTFLEPFKVEFMEAFQLSQDQFELPEDVESGSF